MADDGRRGEAHRQDLPAGSDSGVRAVGAAAPAQAHRGCHGETSAVGRHAGGRETAQIRNVKGNRQGKPSRKNVEEKRRGETLVTFPLDASPRRFSSTVFLFYLFARAR